MRRALVTGSAGFIGFNLCLKLLKCGWSVLGIDGFTKYYDVRLKETRNSILLKHKAYVFHEIMLENGESIKTIFQDFKPQVVIHLAAQAGVRYSVDNPQSYLSANIIGTFNLLEAIRSSPVEHFLLASTSSIYGSNTNYPYKELDTSNYQLSFYAATKKSNESFSHCYAHLHNIPTTCFRFFTAYGPWGRPDMALFKFTKNILSQKPIDVYNNGNMQRDFTYIDDLVCAIYKLIDVVPIHQNGKVKKFSGDSLSSVAPWRVVNIGSGKTIKLGDFLKIIEEKLGASAIKNNVKMQLGDVPKTYADLTLISQLIEYNPRTPIEQGIENFIKWFKEYSEETTIGDNS